MKNIILIGFKNVGKSSVGAALAAELGLRFIDLDTEIEEAHQQKNGAPHKCREIVKIFGEKYFRELEHEALAEILSQKGVVIAVGGGAPIPQENRELMRGHLIIHLTASRGVVFESIMNHGVPAFFSPDKDPYVCFLELWEKRLPIYQSIADCTVDNNGAIESSVRQINQLLKSQNYAIT